jgi:hypothetical protein
MRTRHGELFLYEELQLADCTPQLKQPVATIETQHKYTPVQRPLAAHWTTYSIANGMNELRTSHSTASPSCIAPPGVRGLHSCILLVVHVAGGGLAQVHGARDVQEHHHPHHQHPQGRQDGRRAPVQVLEAGAVAE